MPPPTPLCYCSACTFLADVTISAGKKTNLNEDRGVQNLQMLPYSISPMWKNLTEMLTESGACPWSVWRKRLISANFIVHILSSLGVMLLKCYTDELLLQGFSSIHSKEEILMKLKVAGKCSRPENNPCLIRSCWQLCSFLTVIKSKTLLS